MVNIKKIAALFSCLLLSGFAFAQDAANSTDVLRSNGKIYVVMTVVIVIVLGLFLYLINLDRKVSRMEKESGVGNRQ